MRSPERDGDDATRRGELEDAGPGSRRPRRAGSPSRPDGGSDAGRAGFGRFHGRDRWERCPGEQHFASCAGRHPELRLRGSGRQGPDRGRFRDHRPCAPGERAGAARRGWGRGDRRSAPAPAAAQRERDGHRRPAGLGRGGAELYRRHRQGRDHRDRRHRARSLERRLPHRHQPDPRQVRLGPDGVRRRAVWLRVGVHRGADQRRHGQRGG